MRKQLLVSTIAIFSMVGGMSTPAIGSNSSAEAQSSKWAKTQVIQAMQGKGAASEPEEPLLAVGFILETANTPAGQKLESEASIASFVDKRIDKLGTDAAEAIGDVDSADKISSRLFSVTLEEPLPVDQITGILSSLESAKGISDAEPDVLVTLSRTSLGPLMNSSRQTGAVWGLDRIDQKTLPLSSSYDYDSDGRDVLVYVVDTGVMSSHLDFEGRVLSGANFVPDGRPATSDC